MYSPPVRILLALTLALVTGCGDDDAAAPEVEQTYDRLATTGWLAENLGDDDLVVIDARKTSDYQQGHIPGAVSASFAPADAVSNGVPVSYGGGIDLFLDLDNPVPFQDGSPAEVEAAMRKLGIRHDSRVVVYDNGLDFHATRFLFTLEHNGHRSVRVLNGGLGKWKAEGRDVTTATEAVAQGDFTCEPALQDDIATTDDVILGLLDPTVHVVTSLPASWHFGTYLAYSEPGHIAGAKLIPLAFLFKADGTWRPKAELRALLEVYGIGEDDTIISYCGGNPLSAAAFFTWRYVLGHERVRNYTGSLVTWLDDPRDLPVHTYQHPELLRDTLWVHWWAGERIQTLLMDPPALTIDVRDATLHDEAHIPWSVSLPGADPLARTATEWSDALGAVGVDTTMEAVVCDETITPRLASMFWLLEHLGHPQVSVCSEGLSGWTAAGWELTDVPTLIAEPEDPLDVAIHPTTFDGAQTERVRVEAPTDKKLHASFPRLWVVASEETPAALAGETVVKVPWQDHLTADGRMKTAAELWTLYEAQGVNHFTEVVVAATDWREGAVSYLALRLLGLPMVRLYVPDDGAL